MTTKTDFHAIMELKKTYTPAERSIVNAAEAEMIREVLELKLRNDTELQNIRDMAVLLYSKWADAQEQKNNHPAMIELMDVMSAICGVIDQEKFNRGLPV